MRRWIHAERRHAAGQRRTAHRAEAEGSVERAEDGPGMTFLGQGSLCVHRHVEQPGPDADGEERERERAKRLRERGQHGERAVERDPGGAHGPAAEPGGERAGDRLGQDQPGGPAEQREPDLALAQADVRLDRGHAREQAAEQHAVQREDDCDAGAQVRGDPECLSAFRSRHAREPARRAGRRELLQPCWPTAALSIPNRAGVSSSHSAKNEPTASTMWSIESAPNRIG